jgi:hypothetical protein
MVQIETRLDSERGCGWRKEGGLYLISGNGFTACERLPLPLDRCPTCDHGVKPSRGWTWIDGDVLFMTKPCTRPDPFGPCNECSLCRPSHRQRPCPVCKHDTSHRLKDILCEDEECRCDRPSVSGFIQEGIGRAGLLWVGEKFYATPAKFGAEAARQGISRRIHQIPKEFVVGETPIFMAHRKAVPTGDDESMPGIFMVFKPSAIEYVVKGDETEEELERLVKRGITPVHVKRLEPQLPLFDVLASPVDGQPGSGIGVD